MCAENSLLYDNFQTRFANIICSMAYHPYTREGIFFIYISASERDFLIKFQHNNNIKISSLE
jgi:hypothetical protein